MQKIIVHDYKTDSEVEYHKANHDNVVSSTDLFINKAIKKGSDGVQYEAIRSKRSNERNNEKSNKREVVGWLIFKYVQLHTKFIIIIT